VPDLRLGEGGNVQYDGVVIGSGIGGLCVSARLAAAGYKVLLLERIGYPGGRCSSTEVDGFTLSTGALVLPAGGRVEEAWRLAGAVWNVRMPDPQFVYRVAGTDHTVPPKGALVRLMGVALGDEAEAKRLWAQFKRALDWSAPPSVVSFREWLGQYNDNPHLHGLFQAIIGAWLGVNSHELPAPEFFSYLKEVGHMRGYGWAPHGSRALADAMVAGLRRMGVDVWFTATARQIEVADDRVTGVRVIRDRQEVLVPARFVVSDVAPRRTAELVGRDRLDVGYLRSLDEVLRPYPVVATYIASRERLLPYPGALVTAGTRRVVLVMPLTNLCPELAPPGWHLTASYGVPPNSLDFDPAKEQQVNLADLRDLCPNWDAAGVRVVRQSVFRGEWPAGHAWPGYDMPIRTPVRGLYQVGDGAKPSGWSGIEASGENARLVCEDVTRQFPVQAGNS